MSNAKSVVDWTLLGSLKTAMGKWRAESRSRSPQPKRQPIARYKPSSSSETGSSSEDESPTTMLSWNCHAVVFHVQPKRISIYFKMFSEGLFMFVCISALWNIQGSHCLRIWLSATLRVYEEVLERKLLNLEFLIQMGPTSKGFEMYFGLRRTVAANASGSDLAY